MQARELGAASSWVRRWSHLVRPGARVLDVACGHGRHMQWFAQQQCQCVGVDRSSEALAVAQSFGQVLQADIEQGAWPLRMDDQFQTFDVLVVTNYLWRPLFPTFLASLAPGGLFLYETFAAGNETVGKPSRPDFLLRPGELLQRCASLRVIAFEDGYLEHPARFVQRIVAQQAAQSIRQPEQHLLSLE